MAAIASPLDRVETPVRDRLVTTVFLAAVLHGMVILGVTFTAEDDGGDAAPGLQVQLVSDETRRRDATATTTPRISRSATQQGAGTRTAERSPPHAARPASAAGRPGRRTKTPRDAGHRCACRGGQRRSARDFGDPARPRFATADAIDAACGTQRRRAGGCSRRPPDAGGRGCRRPGADDRSAERPRAAGSRPTRAPRSSPPTSMPGGARWSASAR